METGGEQDVEERLRALLAAGDAAALITWVRDLSRADEAIAQALLEEALASGGTADAAVALPVVLDRATSKEELAELAAAVADRPEKSLRRAFLKRLVPYGDGGYFDHNELLVALDVLAARETDPGLLVSIDRKRGMAGAPPPLIDPSIDQGPSGLWGLRPMAVPGLPERPFAYDSLRHRWMSHLSTRPGVPDERLTEKVLTALAEGDLEARDLLTVSHELLVTGSLNLERAARYFGALVLGGAMSQVWPVAMGTAEASVARSSTTPGLSAFLRMLAHYAAETPGPSDLPPLLAQLARDGHTDAGRQAHELGARLARTPPDDYDPGPAAAAEPVPDHLGLWVERTESDPQRLSLPVRRDLESLPKRLNRVKHESQPRSVTRKQFLLDELAALIRLHGAANVREAMSGFRALNPECTTTRAIEAWVSGVVTPEVYWRVAARGISTVEVREIWAETMTYAESGERFRRETPASLLDQDPPVIGRWWAASLGTRIRLEMLHTLEVLLVAEAGGSMVSAPCKSDGTLCVNDLLSRLAEATCVGPVDVLVALHRLRNGTPADAARVAGEVPTAATVTTPGGALTTSASATVRSWLAGTLDVTLVDEPSDPVRVSPPVPWESCDAVATRPGFAAALTRGEHGAFAPYLLPGRPLLVLGHGFRSQGRNHTLADVGGPLDPAVWAHVLEALRGEPDKYVHQEMTSYDLEVLARLSAQGRLDGTAAVTACEAGWDDRARVLGDGRGWEHAFLRGAMVGLWPVAIQILDSGLRRADPPAELGGLVEVLARRVHEVPEPVIPDAVVAFAAEASDSPLHRAVRSFAAAGDRARRSRGSRH
ncbi:hypothetical protein EXE58_07565 [Nocardioides seonyuensis]|uniref:Uncharacterized protein n=1 Tax=Nocardioides seonyuensis TaxID=2518371 RepID=A0A4P7IDQ7_9ACTN|nr:hypothetical protein [Nocardioides seonyuensis]QBX55325.1 hypothetical protein EXE58_07565 [Nocardioides seonyuensis]